MGKVEAPRRVALIVDSRSNEQQLKKIFLEQLLPRDVFPLVNKDLKEAAGSIAEYASNIVLLVVDNDAPSGQGASKARGRGAEFVGRHVVGARGMVPPAIVTYRSYDLSPPQIASGRVYCMKDSEFTRYAIQRKLEEWGIPLSRNDDLSFDQVDADLLDKAERGDLRLEFASVLEAVAGSSWRSVWKIADQLDRALGRRDRVNHRRPNEVAAARMYQWLQKLPKASDAQKTGGDFERYTRLLLLEAELLWFVQPTIAFYLLIEAISLRVARDTEPLGQQRGELIYSVACRIKAKLPLRPAIPDETFDPSLWHELLRDIVRRAVADAREEAVQSSSVLIHMEREMQALQRKFEERSNSPAALEVEARTCEIRRHRLKGLPRLLSKVLALSSDYGNQPVQLLLWCSGVVLVFAVLYQPSWFPDSWPGIQIEFPSDKSGAFELSGRWLLHCPAWFQWLGRQILHIPMSLYFSLESFFNLGYGDFSALNSVGRMIVSLEGLLGLFAFGLLIAVASTKLRPR